MEVVAWQWMDAVLLGSHLRWKMFIKLCLFFCSRVVKVLFIEALKMLLKTVNKMASQEAKEKRKTHNTPK